MYVCCMYVCMYEKALTGLCMPYISHMMMVYTTDIPAFSFLPVVAHIHTYIQLRINYQVAVCFLIPYYYANFVSYVSEWTPHWVPISLWYLFLAHVSQVLPTYLPTCIRTHTKLMMDDLHTYLHTYIHTYVTGLGLTI